MTAVDTPGAQPDARQQLCPICATRPGTTACGCPCGELICATCDTSFPRIADVLRREAAVLADPTDRQLIVDALRWARAHGWTRDAEGWIDREQQPTWTTAVDVHDGHVNVGRESANGMHGQYDQHRVDSVRQGVDILVALGILPPHFSSAYRAALAVTR